MDLTEAHETKFSATIQLEQSKRIEELEAELKTAKSDGIKEAVKECEFDFMGEDDLQICLSSTLIKYANK